MDADSFHFLHSSLREKVIEHLFVGQLLRELWIAKRNDFEVLRSEVDRGGYDVAVECAGVLRYIQLKASHKGATARSVNVHVNLEKKQNGCVIWILFDPSSLSLERLLWYGKPPGAQLDLGDKVARQPRANALGQKALKPEVRVLARSRFTPLRGMDELIHHLFGLTT